MHVSSSPTRSALFTTFVLAAQLAACSKSDPANPAANAAPAATVNGATVAANTQVKDEGGEAAKPPEAPAKGIQITIKDLQVGSPGTELEFAL